MNLNKKTYISLGVFLIVGILLIVLIILPLFNKIKKNSEELQYQKNNLSSFPQETKNLEDIKNFYDNNRENLEKIDTLFINSEFPIEFIKFLEETATQSKVSIEISQIATTKKENDFWPSISFQIVANGPSADFLKFLEKLENNPYLIEILNLNLTKSTKKEEISSVNATFSIKVFST